MSDHYLKKLFGLEGKSVLVTGATGQLGHEFCSAFLSAGAKVIGADKDLNREKMITSDRCRYLTLDIADKGSVEKVFDDIYSSGELDILINNAGVSCFEPFEERPEPSFDWVMNVNLKGTFFCIQEYARRSKRNSGPKSVVNIASVYGLISPDFRIYTDTERHNSEVYGATKAGIIQMTRYFAVHLASRHIRVNSISPGGIYNPEAPQGEEFISLYSERNPMGRMAEAGEMVGAALYLASPAASYTTGHNLVVDGGMTSW
ncbi:MAG: SDR family oxidoreductase [Candidatus Marinimicrobia bacterium]|nr:SDR family oxidoreductase [Candidatus Neomarinimicrobiota bacterium]